MKNSLIFSQPGNRRLILIFAGWSTTPDFYCRLHAEGWDIAVIWDYTSLDFNSEILKDYATVFVVAWSLGVAAAAHAAATTLEAHRISAAFAVNGTLYPSSDRYGIPEAIYESTRATLSAKNLLKFTKRMGYVPEKYDKKSAADKQDVYIPDFESLALELENMRSLALKGSLPWKRVYISSSDRIFPPDSMRAYWLTDPARPEIINLDAPHYLNLQKIINEITPDLSKIGNRFHRAVSTYDANASAQQAIVDNLADMLPVEAPRTVRNLLEIGTGSGLLARNLIKRLNNLDEATYLDLYPLQKLNLVSSETYIEADAENWILEVKNSSYDLIASANTIQWFADPENFFRHAARALRPGGYFLCSTFLKGNLAELDIKRPSPLIYRTEAELSEMLHRYFRHVTLHTEPVVLKFPGRRELLLHLKLTGVAGGSPSTLPYVSSSPCNPITPESSSNPNVMTLTYRPLYILAYN